MNAYRVVGSFPNGKMRQKFTQDIVASDEADAEHRILSSFGSRHRVKRRTISIESIDQIDPSTSSTAAVISAFGGDTPSKSSTPPAASEEE